VLLRKLLDFGLPPSAPQMLVINRSYLPSLPTSDTRRSDTCPDIFYAIELLLFSLNSDVFLKDLSFKMSDASFL